MVRNSTSGITVVKTCNEDILSGDEARAFYSPLGHVESFIGSASEMELYILESIQEVISLSKRFVTSQNSTYISRKYRNQQKIGHILWTTESAWTLFIGKCRSYQLIFVQIIMIYFIWTNHLSCILSIHRIQSTRTCVGFGG